MLYEKKAMAKGRSVKVFALVLALLLSLSFPVLADGSYTVMGTVYGNGIVMLNGTTFTLSLIHISCILPIRMAVLS